MAKRRISYPRRQLRNALRRFLKRNLLGLAGVALLWVLVLELLDVFLHGYLLGLLQGVLLAMYVGLVGLSFLLVAGTTFQLSGVWGEDNSRDTLKAAKRRGHIVGWIDNLEVADGDVDHLVVTKSGIWAVDSKWHSHGLDQTTIDRDVSTALRAARRASNILRSLDCSLEVQPLIVVWGGEQEAVRGGKEKGGVPFVAGREFKAWLAANAACSATLGDQTGQTLLIKLAEFKSRVDPSTHPRFGQRLVRG